MNQSERHPSGLERTYCDECFGTMEEGQVGLCDECQAEEEVEDEQ